MNQIKDFDGLIGKAINRVVDCNENIYLFFECDSFAVISVEGWEEHYPVLRHDSINMEPNRYNIDDLLLLGFIDKDTFDQYKQIFGEDDRRRIEFKEIAELKKLKEKYPNY